MDQETCIRGAAFGLAFEAYMIGENPELSDDAKKAYKWAEKQFLRLAKDQITEDEAVVGYGG